MGDTYLSGPTDIGHSELSFNGAFEGPFTTTEAVVFMTAVIAEIALSVGAKIGKLAQMAAGRTLEPMTDWVTNDIAAIRNIEE